MGYNGGGVAYYATGKRLVPIRVEHKVIGNAIAFNHTVQMALFRNVCYPELRKLPWGAMRHVLSAELNCASYRMPQTCERFYQLRLAVPLHPSHAEDFAGMQAQGHAVNRHGTAFVHYPHILHPQHYFL
jgi:hypothetical protein